MIQSNPQCVQRLTSNPVPTARWSVKKRHAERASAVTDTQAEALKEARRAPEGDIKLKGKTAHSETSNQARGV
jgi:Uncharacterized protein conserved in bacteria (DUF2188)